MSPDMSTRTLLPKPRKAAPKLRTINLREQFAKPDPVFFAPMDVDEETGVIKRIKILGWESRNGRRYLPEAVKPKLHYYDGAKAFCDHPKRATDTRDCDDALGVWRNPVLEADGVYADLHYFRSHPLASRVVEDAKRGLGVFGASHNADGKVVDDPSGDSVVHDLLEVRSVDLVTDAATVTNLRESRHMQTTLRQLIEASKAKPLFKHLLEMPEDEMPPLDMPMDAPPEAPVEGDWKADLVSAIGKLVSSENEEDHKLAQKVMAMLKPQVVAPPEEIITEDEEEDKEEDKEEKVAESRKRKPTPDAVTLTEAKAKRLCKLASVPEDPDLLEALKSLTEEKAMSLLEWQQKRAVPPARSTVRSQGPGTFDSTPTDEALYRNAVARLTGRELVAAK